MYSLETQVETANSPDKSVGLRVTGVSKNDVTIILPVLNEEGGIGAVIDEVLASGFQKVLVVDGYSTDLTAEVARGRGVTVVQQHGRGKTGAIRTAIDHVTTPYMLFMDGDFTYAAPDIRRFLDHAKGYDQIIGARSRENISRVHRFGKYVICGMFNVMFGTQISDVCSGMYLLKSETARRLTFHTKGFSVEAEILAQTATHGNVTEVPIEYRSRIGSPKLSTAKSGFDIMKSMFGLARIHNPVFTFSIFAGAATIPGLAILTWAMVDWLQTGVFHSGWALAGGILMLFASQAFMLGTISLLQKRSEIRLERLIRSRDGEVSEEKLIEGPAQ